MEVHKPKLVRNWRELFKEWGIIVLGVLTALLAEQAVQSIEWRHKVNAAISDMMQELGSANGPQAYTRLAIHGCLADRLKAVRQAVEGGDREASRSLIETIWLPKATYDSYARESAVASDVASHMPAEKMFNFRIVYALVPELDRLHEKELSDLSHLRSLPATGGPLLQAEKLAEIDAVEALELDNDRSARSAAFTLRHFRDVDARLDRGQLQRNLAFAQTHYGSCLTRDLAPLINRKPLNSW